MNETKYTTPLRPHKVLGRAGIDGDQHALMLTDGDFAGIVFSFVDVKFKEEDRDEEDVLVVGFEYSVHEVPNHLRNYDKCAFEKELGDFLIELIYYGLERDFLGFTDSENRENDSFQPNSQ